MRLFTAQRQLKEKGLLLAFLRTLYRKSPRERAARPQTNSSLWLSIRCPIPPRGLLYFPEVHALHEGHAFLTAAFLQLSPKHAKCFMRQDPIRTNVALFHVPQQRNQRSLKLAPQSRSLGKHLKIHQTLSTSFPLTSLTLRRQKIFVAILLFGWLSASLRPDDDS